MPGTRSKPFPRGELADYAKRFLDDYRDEGNSPLTVRDYRSTLRRLCEYYRDTPVGAFDGPEGTRLLQKFLRETFPDANPKTIKKNVAALRSFFRWCEDYEYVGRDPSRRLKVPRGQSKRREAVPHANIVRLIEAQPELHDRLAIMLAAMLGLRRGAVRGVRLRDFDLHAGVLRVTSKGNKTRDMPIVYAEIKLAVEGLYSAGWEPSWYLLHPRRQLNLPGQERELREYSKPLSNTAFQAWWRKRFEICGDVPIHDFHSLRTSAGTRMYIKTGHDVKATQKFLGHASAQTTLDHYVDLDQFEQIAAMKKARWTDDE